MNKLMLKAGVFAMSVISASVAAKVSPEEAARLGQDLTPIGAEKAANADGSIPAWDGGSRWYTLVFGLQMLPTFTADTPSQEKSFETQSHILPILSCRPNSSSVFNPLMQKLV